MTRSQKTSLAGLALILLLFVAVLFMGAGQPACKGSSAQCAHDNPAGAGMKHLGSLFSAGGAKLPEPSIALLPGQRRAIVLAPGDGLRVLKIALRNGELLGTDYEDAAPDKLPHAPGQPASPQQGDVPGAAASPDDARAASFTLSSAGGTLTLTCKGTVPCTIVQP